VTAAPRPGRHQLAAVTGQIPNRPVRVGLISLGCAKNLVDAEIMLGTLAREGMEFTNDAARADVLLVNTCAFIDAAQQEGVDAILELAQLREARRRGQALVVAGCLPQRFREQLPRLLPEVDAFMGGDQVPQVAGIVRQALARRAQTMAESQAPLAEALNCRKGIQRTQRISPLHASVRSLRSVAANSAIPSHESKTISPPPLVEVHPRPAYLPDHTTPRFRLTPRHSAYVKIAEGCNHPCSFCTIPRIRGRQRSRPPADIVAEARRLLAAGVKELNLISQDSTRYGLDLRPGQNGALGLPARTGGAAQSPPAETPTLCALLRELNALPGEFWIRLLYTHPAHWSDELIETIAACPKVARYVDIPLQHIHDLILERMRRETSRAHIVQLLRRIRARLPGITLRTTFIVGFPGETETQFQALLDFIQETRFERLGVFTFSREEGTVAGRMANQTPAAVKRRRRDAAMRLQRGIAGQLAGAGVGSQLKVLVEHPATAADLRQAEASSCEHGLVRQAARPRRLPKGPWSLARSEADAPDIDGRVYVRGQLPPGEFAQVHIVGHTDYDLIAEPE
jgi:ribosomal protein S12 methylthiotransferase